MASELPKRTEGRAAGGPDLAGWAAWLRLRLLPGGSDALMVAAYAILLTALITFILSPGELSSLAYYTTILCISAMFVLQVVWSDLQARLGELRAAWLHLSLSAGLYLLATYASLGGGGGGFLPFVLFMLTAQAIVTLPAGAGAAYSALLTAGWFAVIWLLGLTAQEMVGNLVSIGLGQIFTVTFSRVIVLYQRQTARAQALADELRASRERERELSAADERLRLAREIHDGLGHHLTALNVQLQAAGRLIERDPQRAARAIAICREEAQAALAEVRRSVAAMRSGPLDGRPLAEAVAALVADFARASPMQPAFRSEGEPRELGAAAALTLYRAAQEGLTNAQKYAGAGPVDVALLFAPESTALRVRDAGGQAAPAAGGFGLAGLRERAEQLGGAFYAGRQPDGGFLLEVRLPL